MSLKTKIGAAVVATAVIVAIAVIGTGSGSAGYNQADVNAFFSGCEANGVSASSCQCILHYVEDDLSPSQFHQAVVSTVYADEFSAAEQSCGV